MGYIVKTETLDDGSVVVLVESDVPLAERYGRRIPAEVLAAPGGDRMRRRALVRAQDLANQLNGVACLACAV